MARRFIVATNSPNATKNDRNKITRFLEEKGSVWHWFEDLWLVNSSENYVLSEIRDELSKRVRRDVNVVILSGEGELERSGYVNAAAIPWLSEFWDAKIPEPRAKTPKQSEPPRD